MEINNKNQVQTRLSQVQYTDDKTRTTYGRTTIRYSHSNVYQCCYQPQEFPTCTQINSQVFHSGLEVRGVQRVAEALRPYNNAGSIPSEGACNVCAPNYKLQEITD